MTETVAATHFAGDLPEMGARYTIGRPIDSEARVLGADGQAVTPGAVGELVVRGANITTGYLGDPERTAEVLRDGWFHTGDLVRETPQGDHEIVGRRDEVINCGGFMIQPDEIDEVVATLPGVREAKTIAMADPVLDAIPVTLYAADAGLPPVEVLAHCRAGLEARKMPKRAIRVEKIPRTASGKPDLGALSALVEKRDRRARKAPKSLPNQVIELAARVFGVAPKTLGLDDTPETTKGWDSYAHTALMLEAEETFGVELPVGDIIGIETLGDLVAAVERAQPTAEASPPIRIKSVRDGRGNGSLFALPGMTGQNAPIKHLLKGLSEVHEIHAISADPDPDLTLAGRSLQELGEAFAETIQSVGAKPPITLFGASFGGFLAYETALALMRRGAELNGIVLNDVAVPWPHRKAHHLHRLALRFRNLRRKRKVDTAQSYGVADFGWLNLRPLHPSRHAFACRAFDSLSRYRPSTGSVRQLVFVASHRKKGLIPIASDLGWSAFNAGEITAVPLGETHFSALGDPETAKVAAAHINAFMSVSQPPR